MRSTPSHGISEFSSSPSSAEVLSFEDVAVRNQLLSALDATALTDIKPHFETVNIARPAALFGAPGSIGHVYFPENAVVSLVNTLRGGRVEESAVGREGMAGLSVFLNGSGSSVQAFAQVCGVARRMDARVFRRLSATPGPLHQIMLKYTQAFLAHIAQTAACSASHLLQERCAGWLLMTRDRVDASAFPLTHDILATMLGARRDGVTLSVRSFEDKELIRYRRGRVEIVDANGLERESCDCHRILRLEYARLLPTAA